MSKATRVVICLMLVVCAVAFYVVPDPLPIVDEILMTLSAIVGVGKQIRGITMKNHEDLEHKDSSERI